MSVSLILLCHGSERLSHLGSSLESLLRQRAHRLVYDIGKSFGHLYAGFGYRDCLFTVGFRFPADKQVVQCCSDCEYICSGIDHDWSAVRLVIHRRGYSESFFCIAVIYRSAVIYCRVII